jgi:hypothetical protein
MTLSITTPFVLTDFFFFFFNRVKFDVSVEILLYFSTFKKSFFYFNLLKKTLHFHVTFKNKDILQFLFYFSTNQSTARFKPGNLRHLFYQLRHRSLLRYIFF